MKSLLGKNKYEEFSKESLFFINFSKFVKVNEEEHLKLLKELEEIKALVQQFRSDILFELDEISKGICLSDENFAKPTEEEVKAVPDSIKEALSKGTKSFSELLEETQVTAPTLSKYLGKMVDEGTVERIETDRKVLYRLKG